MRDNCGKFAVELSVYFDGELEGEAAEAMEGHLEVCPSCRASLEKMRRIRSAMHTAAKGPRTQRRSMVDEIMARLDDGGKESTGA